MTSDADDGSKKARFPGRARISRKTLRGEGRMFGQTCGYCRQLFICWRAMGAACTRPSLRPLLGGGTRFMQNPGAEGAPDMRSCALLFDKLIRINAWPAGQGQMAAAVPTFE